MNDDYAYTVEPVQCGHLETGKKCPDYKGVLISHAGLPIMSLDFGVYFN